MPHVSPLAILCVALGGAIGASARFIVAAAAAARFGAAFPIGTLAVNVIGSFFLGLAAALLVEAAGDAAGSTARARAAFVMTGVLGGFTTFSTFALDLVALGERERYSAAALYLIGSVALSVAAAAAGLWLGRIARG